MKISLHRRRRRFDQELADADRSLAAATQSRIDQTSKRDIERRTVIATMDRLAEENHLGALVWNVVTDRDRS